MKSMKVFSKKATSKMTIVVVAAVIIAATIGGAYYWFMIPKGPIVSEVTIGVLEPLTGGLALFGKQSVEAFEVARAIVNDRGGIKSLGGAKIKFIVADSKSDPTVGVTEVERLISLEKVPVILGSYASAICLPCSATAERHGIVYFESIATATAITERGLKWLFRFSPQMGWQMEVTAEFINNIIASKLGKKPTELVIVTLAENSEWGNSFFVNFKNESQKIGMKIALSEFYSPKTTDLSGAILKLKALNPDLLVGAYYAEDIMLLVRQMRTLNWNVPAHVCTSGGVTIKEFYDAVGTDGDYIFGQTWATAHTPERRAKLHPDLDMADEYFKKVHGFGFQDNPYHYISFCAAMALFKAIENAGSVEPEKIRVALRSLDLSDKDNWGIGCKFDEKGQNHRSRFIIFMVQNQDCKPLWVYPLERAQTQSWIPTPPWSERPKP